MHEPVDAAHADLFVEGVLLHGLAEIAAFLGPVSLLDDAAIHIGDVEGSIGRGVEIDGAEERVGRADELGLFVRIAEDGDAVFHFDLRAADEAADGFAEEKFSA